MSKPTRSIKKLTLTAGLSLAVAAGLAEHYQLLRNPKTLFSTEKTIDKKDIRVQLVETNGQYSYRLTYFDVLLEENTRLIGECTLNEFEKLLKENNFLKDFLFPSWTETQIKDFERDVNKQKESLLEEHILDEEVTQLEEWKVVFQKQGDHLSPRVQKGTTENQPTQSLSKWLFLLSKNAKTQLHYTDLLQLEKTLQTACKKITLESNRIPNYNLEELYLDYGYDPDLDQVTYRISQKEKGSYTPLGIYQEMGEESATSGKQDQHFPLSFVLEPETLPVNRENQLSLIEILYLEMSSPLPEKELETILTQFEFVDTNLQDLKLVFQMEGWTKDSTEETISSLQIEIDETWKSLQEKRTPLFVNDALLLKSQYAKSLEILSKEAFPKETNDQLKEILTYRLEEGIISNQKEDQIGNDLSSAIDRMMTSIEPKDQNTFEKAMQSIRDTSDFQRQNNLYGSTKQLKK